MNKKYQVFISSTFTDLKDERKEITRVLLEMDCIPTGMEMFQASDDNQWQVIKRVISLCDYYLVIIAGRYGSVHPKTKKSYTQMEYEYIKQSESNKRDKGYAWHTAIGLQAVDGLKPSKYLIDNCNKKY